MREGPGGDLVAVSPPTVASPVLPFFGPHSRSWHRRRGGARSGGASRAAAALCACPCSPFAVPCTDDAVPGSALCRQCAPCAHVGAVAPCCCPCVRPAEFVSPPAPYVWADRTPVVFVSYCCGAEDLAYACNRLREAPGSVVLAVDVYPRSIALANVALAPVDLARLLYVQVSAASVPTPHLVRSLLASVCGALPAHVVELECGLPCTTYTTRSGRDSNPHRVSGTLVPRTRAGRLADLFRRELFVTLHWLRSEAPGLSFLLENPLHSLLWRHPEVQAFTVAVGARLVAVDHCVAAVTPADLALGSPQKPSGHLALGYPTVPDVRCAALGCAHRLPAPLADRHAHAIQLPGRSSGRRVPGQVRVPARYAARHPEGLHGVVFSLARRAGALPASAMVSAPTPAVLADPDPTFAAPDVRLHRLTPQACVYSAVELHAIFGHVLPDARMVATLNGHLDFRMKRADGSIVCSPDITVADVALPGPCHVCAVTRMQDVGSRRLHPSAARSRRAAARSSPSAASVSFAPPLALSAMCGGAGGLGSLLLPVSLSAAGPSVPDVDLPEEAQPALSAGSSSSSSSSSSSEHSPGTAPEGSDADVDAECDVGRPPVFADYPDRLLAVLSAPLRPWSPCRGSAGAVVLFISTSSTPSTLAAAAP